MVEQVSVFLENTTGRLAELTRTLGEAGINMHALMLADTSEFGVVRIICDAPAHAKRLLDERGFSASITPVLAVRVPDRPAGLAELLESLDAAGMGVEYAYCFVQPTGEYAVDVLKIDNPLAEDTLTKAGFYSLSPSDLYTPDD